MKLRRKPPPPRRQRLRSTEPAPLPAAFSYHARRSERQDDSQRRKQVDAEDSLVKRRSQPRFSKPVSAAITVGAIFLAIGLLSLSTQARVVTVNDSGLLTNQSNAYAQAAQAALNSSLLSYCKLTVDTTAVSRSILTQFPELASVSVTVPFIGFQPTVHVAAASPALLLAATNGTYLVDDRGVAVALQPNIPAAVSKQLPTITDQSNLQVRVGKTVLPQSQVAFIRVVLRQLAAKQVQPTTLILPPATSEFDVHLAGQPYYVKFNMQSDTAREEAGTFLATKQQLEGQHVTPNQYIDVRVSGRAYYQ